MSDFILQSALAKAAETLPDRTRFGLDADDWATFHALLDAPPKALPRLAALLAEDDCPAQHD